MSEAQSADLASRNRSGSVVPVNGNPVEGNAIVRSVDARRFAPVLQRAGLNHARFIQRDRSAGIRRSTSPRACASAAGSTSRPCRS
jgi:hypothetical protein